MITEVVTAPPSMAAEELRHVIESDQIVRRQRLFPVVEDDEVLGVVGWGDLITHASEPGTAVGTLAHTEPVVAFPDETLRYVADRMAEHQLGALPVIERDSRHLVGVITQFELLAGRRRQLMEERHRERTLRPRLVRRRSTGDGAVAGADPQTLPPAPLTVVGEVMERQACDDARRTEEMS